MKCKIVSPREERTFDDLMSIVLPGVRGELEVLPGHAESFIKLKAGTVILRSKQIIDVSVSDAICYVKDNDILIIE